jgi:hypothetical protein
MIPANWLKLRARRIPDTGERKRRRASAPLTELPTHREHQTPAPLSVKNRSLERGDGLDGVPSANVHERQGGGLDGPLRATEPQSPPPSASFVRRSDGQG